MSLCALSSQQHCYNNLPSFGLVWEALPPVYVSPAVVVEKGMVQLDKDRKGQCKGVDDVGFRVLVRG